jgi:UDP-N-acetylglucosamine diphosphorylase/glucosamine-1-phosphate N-acetyltransferase
LRANSRTGMDPPAEVCQEPAPPARGRGRLPPPPAIEDNPDMSHTPLVLWDDAGGDFGPLTDLRAAFELRTGAYTTRQRIESVLGRPAGALRVPAALEALVRARAGAEGPAVNRPLDAAGNGPVLVVNARWTGAAGAAHVQGLRPGAHLLQGDGQLVAALLPVAQTENLLAGAAPAPDRAASVIRIPDRMLMDRPWHVLDGLEQALRIDLQAPAGATGRRLRRPVSLAPGARVARGRSARGTRSPLAPRMGQQARPPGTHAFGSHTLTIAAGATVQPGVVFNLEQGPIAIEAAASIGAGTVLEGPCFLGEHSVVQPLSLLRPCTVIGPYCKVAGEISFSIIHGYTNKAHAGYLGQSLVGQWVNLGASTVVSNLKNTYGRVRVTLRPGGAAEDSGRLFQGPIIGDFVRTAIGTRILTGSCLQTGSMLALSAYAPKSTPRFAFLTDRGAQVHDLEKFLATVRTMMARRQMQLGGAEEARLRDLFTRAADR